MRKATDTAPKKLFQPEPPAEMVEDALDLLTTMDLAMFADHVETARTIWRKFPELVDLPSFPSSSALLTRRSGARNHPTIAASVARKRWNLATGRTRPLALSKSRAAGCRATARPPAPRARNTHDLCPALPQRLRPSERIPVARQATAARPPAHHPDSRKDLFSCQYLQTTKPTSCSLNTNTKC